MAIEGERQNNQKAVKHRKVGAGGKMLVGTNVLISVILVLAIVAAIQWGVFHLNWRADLTSSGVNSLSEGTVKLIGHLDTDITITSTYFQTDLENEDQARYRQMIQDLIDLYAGASRGKIRAASFNPLQDIDQQRQLFERIRNIEKFKSETDDYVNAIDRFTSGFVPRIQQLFDSEKKAIETVAVAGGEESGRMMQLKQQFEQFQLALTAQVKDVNTFLEDSEVPQYTAAKSVIQQYYGETASYLDQIAAFGRQYGNTIGDERAREFLEGASDRYGKLRDDMLAERTKLNELPPMQIDHVLRQLNATDNSIVIETAKDATVVPFSEVWPPIDQSGESLEAKFGERQFLGEQKITAAILKLTHEQKTAVIFTRFGGDPLFLDMPSMGGMRAQKGEYVSMKKHLQEANFIVDEWDVAASNEPPAIDPDPEKRIYVVFKPSPPPQSPMAQQQVPFSPAHEEAILNAVKESGRSMFMIGWHPGAFAGLPSEYEFGQFLIENWGIRVDTNILVIKAMPIGHNQYVLRGQPVVAREYESGEHPIAKSLHAQPTAFPYVAPLTLTEPAPENVQISELLTLTPQDGLWGARDPQYYQEHARDEYLVKNEGDIEGPFLVAVAAEKTGAENVAKTVVVSARQFAGDALAFAPGFVRTSQGFALRPMNPGNVTVFLNALHWLNDNEEWLNLGRPIEAHTLEIADKEQVQLVQWLSFAAFPGLALLAGGVMWMIRRR